MREFEFVLDEALTNGLRPERKMPRNSQILTGCLGFRVGKYSIENFNYITNPIPPAVNMFYKWPFPQFLIEDKYRILVIRDTMNMEDMVYSLNSDYSIATQILAIDELTFGKGSLMELADFGEYAFMTNGVVMLYWDPVINGWQKTASHINIPLMGTVCNFNGQMIGGCVTSDWYGCDETSIIWSRIGEASFTPDRKNEAGFRRDLFGGKVYHVKELGNSVIVYSSNGITVMSPKSTTFGFKKLHNVGIINKGAIAGDFKEHLFVDSDHYVWKINEEGLKKLGYQEYIDTFSVSNDIIVNYDPNEKDFYISDGEITYLLSPYAMTEVPDCQSTIWFDKGLYGLPETTNPPTHTPLIVSSIIDFGYKGSKTIFSIESALGSHSNAEVAIDWKMNIDEDFQRTKFVPFNNSGIASLIISGIEFRICMKFEASSEFDSSLDYIKLRWKMTDLRGLRGVYASPPRGQTYANSTIT